MAAPSSKSKGGDLFYLLVSRDMLAGTDVGTFIEQMLQENLIPFKYSDQMFPASIMWLQAKPLEGSIVA